MKDQYGREIEYMRISITDRCNLRCKYCMPNGVQWLPMQDILSFEEIVLICKEAVPIRSGKESSRVSNVELLERFQEAYHGKEISETGKAEEAGVNRDYRRHGNGPAVYFKIPGFQGSIGFISAIHGRFCDKCNRIRLTSVGELKPCLCFGENISLKEMSGNGDCEGVRRKLEEAVMRKPQMHQFEAVQNITEYKKMSQIGG